MPLYPSTVIKGTYSLSLLIFSVTLIMGLIANRQTSLSNDASPAVAYVAIWAAIIWLGMVEGGQGSLVGLAPVHKSLYADSHPIALKSTSITTKGANLDRYLLGRQFMVCLIVFIVNMSGGPVSDAELWGLPKWVKDMFLGSGLAMILFTCMVGQLNSQVNASHCMLDYINNYFALFTTWVAMAVEFSGILHAAYAIQYVVEFISGKKGERLEDPPTGFNLVFFWFRCIMSLSLLAFCFAVTLDALFAGKTTMWEGVPPGVAVVVFFILLSVVGMLEGMQIAFFAVAKLTPEERGSSKFAKMTCGLLFHGKGNNLPGFMVGRQLCVVSCMFFVARVTSVSIPEGGGNIFGVSDGAQNLFNTGLLGATIVTIVGSITWQLLASAFPIAFLSNPITYFLLRLCLLLEATGICQGAWVLAAIHKKIAGFQRDEVYIGTAEERAAKKLEDDNDQLHLGPGHPLKLPGFPENAPPALQKLLEEDPDVVSYLSSIKLAEEQA